MSDAGRHILSLEVTEAQRALLDAIVEESGLSLSEVIRQALAQLVWDGRLVVKPPPIRSKFMRKEPQP